MANPTLGGMNTPGQQSAYQALTSGFDMPKFNSPQFSSPNGPSVGGTGQMGFNDPFAGGGMGGAGGGGMQSGGGGMGGIANSLRAAAQQIVQSNRQLSASLDRLAAAMGGGGPSGPGRPSGPGGGPPGAPGENPHSYGYGGSKRTLGSFMQNTLFNTGAKQAATRGIFGMGAGSSFAGQAGGLFVAQGLATLIGAGSAGLSAANRLEDSGMSEQYKDFFEGFQTKQGQLIQTAMGKNAGIVGSSQARSTFGLQGLANVGGPTGYATMAGQEAVMNFRMSNGFGQAVNQSRMRAASAYLDNKGVPILQDTLKNIMPSASRQVMGAMLAGIPFSDITNLKGGANIEAGVYQQGLDATRSLRETYINSTAKGELNKTEEQKRIAAVEKATNEIVMPIQRINFSAALRSATTVEGRMGASAQFGGARFAKDPVRQAQLRAGFRASAASITALKGLGGVVRGMESGLVDFAGNVRGETFAGGGMGAINGGIGGGNATMTGQLGMFGDALGINTTDAAGIVQSLIQAQGFVGMTSSRATGRMGRQQMSGGARVLRAKADTDDFAFTRAGENITDQMDVIGARQRGISFGTIGNALALNRGGTGLNGMFGGNTGMGVLRQIEANGLRGSSAQEYISNVNAVQNKVAGSGVIISGAAMDEDMAGVISAGKSGRFGALFGGAGGMKQFNNMFGKGDVSGSFSGMFGDLGKTILQMHALNQTGGKVIDAHEFSAGMTQMQKRDAIFGAVKSNEGRRGAFASLGYTPAQIDVMMRMKKGATIDEANLDVDEGQMAHSLMASDAENQIRDAQVGGEKGLVLRQINIADQVLRETVASRAELGNILSQLKILNAGAGKQTLRQGTNAARQALGN
jgi:hypothetical protein